jgi:hypothetical protein
LRLFKQFLVVLVCSQLVLLPAMSEPQAGGQHAGQISALIPEATRNSRDAKVHEPLQWNDLLETQHAGRVRATLDDGSILSVGSNSQLRIVEHNTASQQTSIEMDFGKVRSQVTKISKQGGKFEMRTPNAVIGVIGTDFFVGFEANKTTVICYDGKVTVTPTGNAQVTQNSGQAGTASNAIVVGAGQMVEITTDIPPGGFQLANTPPDVRENGLTATNVPSRPEGHGHVLRNVLIGTGIAVGLGVGLGVAYGTGSGCRKNPASGQCG